MGKTEKRDHQNALLTNGLRDHWSALLMLWKDAMAANEQSTMPGSPATIRDVAQKAGASRTAVSFVLNEKGVPNKHVSKETRARILQAIDDLHFQPDQLARTLRKKQSWELAGIVDATITLFGIEAVASIQQQAQVYGYTPVMYFCQGLSAQQRSELYQTIFARHPFAILASPFNFTAEDVAQARQMGVEYILFYGFCPSPIEYTHSIVFPSNAIGYVAAQHLLERGHRHLALVRPEDPTHAFLPDAFQQRLEGMRTAIAERAEAVDVTLEILPLHLSATAASSLVEMLLTRTPYPTGIYAFNDEYALYLLRALAQHGIRVPQEISVLGTDNLAIGGCVWPSLTSISIDGMDVGKRVVETIHTLHQGLPLSAELTRPLMPCLVQRESTDFVRIQKVAWHGEHS